MSGGEAPSKNDSAEDKVKLALLGLLQEKPIEDVTIKEILARSGVSRRTLYKHYSDKYGLAEAIWYDLFLSCWYESGRPLSLRDAMVKYHVEEQKHQQFLKNALAYEGQNNLWLASSRVFSEKLLDFIVRCGFQSEIDEKIQKFIEMYAASMTGIAYAECKRMLLMGETAVVGTPEERADEEICFIPERLQQYLLGDPLY